MCNLALVDIDNGHNPRTIRNGEKHDQINCSCVLDRNTRKLHFVFCANFHNTLNMFSANARVEQSRTSKRHINVHREELYASNPLQTHTPLAGKDGFDCVVGCFYTAAMT